MQEELRQHMLQYGTINGGSFHDYKEAFFRESEMFLNKFKSIWMKDGYRNYLVNTSESSIHTIKSSPIKNTSNNVPTTTTSNTITTPIKKTYKDDDVINTSVLNSSSYVGNNHTSSNKKKIIRTSSLMRRLKGVEVDNHIDDSNDISNINILDNSSNNVKINDNVSMKSNTISDIGTVSEMRTKKDTLINSLLDKIEESESFVVKDSSNSEYRIVISSKESFDGGRITPIDLRKLFIHKPDLAAVIYDTMVDVKVTKDINETDNLQTIHEEYSDDDDGLDVLIGNT